MNDLHKEILKDRMITKFSFYGFLKNLKFFEPYLLIFLMGQSLNLFEIGILYSIREIIINCFEIPSGFVADYFGRKKELCLCFIFYIISFVFFFFTKSFAIAAIGMAFFGLGEAFRSGTHKAMIYTYLESKGWEKEKTFVYGKTRSASLLGSAISSVLGIVIILNVPHSGYIFLASTIPYLLDFALILSYPSFLDKEEIKKKLNFKEFLVSLKDSVVNKPSLRRVILGEGLFESAVSTIKDFIQPILKTIILGSGLVIITSVTPENNLKIILGIVYALINLLGSFASKKSYLLTTKAPTSSCINIMYIFLALILAFVGFFISQPIVVIILYLFIYVSQNLRKPIFIDEIDKHMKKTERATFLSISSQLKSLFVVVLAPICGYVADHFGINVVMFSLSALLLILIPISRVKRNAVD